MVMDFTCRHHLYPVNKPVRFSSPNMSTSDPWFVYHFHSSISDTTFEGHECAASPCALAALLFTKYYMDDPDELWNMELPDKVFDQVTLAIWNAIDIYQQNFSDRPVTLKPADACGLLRELAKYEVVSVRDIDSSVPSETLELFMLKLQPGHALLVHQEIPYNVIGVVNSYRRNGLVIFSSQKYEPEMKILDDLVEFRGAYVFWSEKNTVFLKGACFAISKMFGSLISSKLALTTVRFV